MICPKCNSDNTQKLSVIFESGTNSINTTGYVAGTGLGSIVGIGGAATKMSGTSQSLLAERVAPPAKKKYKWPMVSILFGVFLLGTVNWLSAVLIAGGVIFNILAWKYNSDQWPGLHQTWLSSWCCNKCGAVYQQA